jgi:hypothetical protein
MGWEENTKEETQVSLVDPIDTLHSSSRARTAEKIEKRFTIRANRLHVHDPPAIPAFSTSSTTASPPSALALFANPSSAKSRFGPWWAMIRLGPMSRAVLLGTREDLMRVVCWTNAEMAKMVRFGGREVKARVKVIGEATVKVFGHGMRRRRRSRNCKLKLSIRRQRKTKREDNQTDIWEESDGSRT